jgi:hypothetical protein
MSAQVLNGEADLAIAQTSMIMMQMPGYHAKFAGVPFISYLIPTSAARLTAIFRQPDAHTAKNIITSTFTTEMWIYWFFLWIIVILSLIVVQRTIKRTSQHYDYFNENFTCMNGSDIFLWGCSNAACQGILFI